MAKKDTNGTIAWKVREALETRPFTLNALTQGIVNYSALARAIQREIGKGSIAAIKAALIREQKRIKTKRTFEEEKIFWLLKNSSINLHDKIAVVISPEKLDLPYIISAGLTTEHVYILDQNKLKLRKIREDKVKIRKNLVALIIKSPEVIERLPGVVAFITELLVGQGINIIEFVSCYTDTVIVLTKEDGLKAFNLLQKFV